jgi:hypothetical protein
MARLKLHRELVPEQLAYPRVLRNRGKPLIEEELKAIVVSPHDERQCPQVWPPVADRLARAHTPRAWHDAAKSRG